MRKKSARKHEDRRVLDVYYIRIRSFAYAYVYDTRSVVVHASLEHASYICIVSLLTLNRR